MTTPTTVTSLPAASSSTPQSYVVTTAPQTEAGVLKWALKNFKLVKTAFDQITLMTPQSATKAPLNPQDGMQRLARAPWCPITAGATNVWVYWDITANTGLGAWVAL